MNKRGLLYALLALAAFAPAHVRAAERRILPADTLALVEVASPADCELKFSNLLWRLAPGAPIGPFRDGLARLAKTEDPSVLDLSAPLQWVLLEGEPLADPIFVFRVVDAERYIDSLPANVHGGVIDGNVQLYEEDLVGAPAANAWEAAPSRPLAIAVLGKRIVLGRSADGVRKACALFEPGRPLSEGPFFAGVDLGGAVRVQRLLALLAEQGLDPFGQTRDSVSGALLSIPQPQMAMQARVIGVFLEGAESLANQTELATATASLTPEAMVFTAGLQAVGGSALDRHLRAMPDDGRELLSCVPAGSLAAFAAEVGDLTPLLDWYMKMFSAIAPKDGSAEDALARIAEKIGEAVALMDGRLASAIVITSEGTFLSAKAVGVRDAVRAEELFNAYGPVVEDMAALQKQAGMPFQMRAAARPNAFTHAGRPITEWVYDFEFGAPEGAAPAFRQAAAMQREFLNAMFGPELKAYSAMHNNVFVTFQGVGALEGLKAVLDGTAAPITGEDRFVASMAGMPEQPVAVGYVALGELFAAYLRMTSRAVQAAGGFMPPFPANMRFEPAPAVGFAAAVDDAGTLDMRLVVPVDAITNIVDGFKGAFASAGPRALP